jgi:PAS domain S-box-containing protein
MIRILLVDDEEPFLEATKFFLLRQPGIEVETATSAKEAMAKMSSTSFDAVVSDYQMPAMDGIELLKILRIQGMNIPFILFTGKGREDTAIEALNNGADFYLQKGGDLLAQNTELLHTLSRLVEYRRSEDALRKSEQRYRLLADSSPEFIYIIGSDGKVIYVNTFAALQLGLSCEEVVGKSLDDLFPPVISQRLVSNVRRVLADGKTLRVENKITYPGREAWLETVLAPLRDSKGEVDSVLGLSRDVTERVVSEEALVNSEARLRLITDNLQDMVAQVDSEGVYLYASPSHKSVLGYEPKDLIGKPSLDFIHPDDRDRMIGRFASVAQASVSYEMDVRFRHSAGHYVWLSTVATRVLDSDGNMVGVITAARDITSRKQIEDSLQKSERFLNSVFSSILDGISILDKDLNIVRVNPTMDLWYRHNVPLVGKKCYRAYHGREDHCEVCPSIQTLRTGKAAFEIVPKVGPEGKVEGWLDLYSFPMLDSSTGELIGVIEYVRDATDRKYFEDALKQANEKLNLLGHVTRHDTLNQLAVLMGWLGVVQETVTEPPSSKHLAAIRTAALAIQRELEFTADYELVGVGKPTWTDVDQACKQGISTLDIGGVVVTIDLDGVEVLADQMFDKVFHNLADNSIRHGKKVTKIWVHYEDSKDGLTLIYEDDGVGIAKADKERIFQRGEGKHTGYGLDLIKGILSITRIKISETGTPGKGVRFELLVPPGSYRIAPKNG